VTAGPAGIRLQEVAADVGVSHPTVLHHFGSREALVRAVISRSLAEIDARIIAAIRESNGDGAQLAAICDGVFEAITAGGHGRVVMWLALEGHRIAGEDVRLADVVDALHELRRARLRRKGRPPSREDTGYLVVLTTLALLGSTVVGPMLLENAGLAHDEAAGARFRAWLARLLFKHLAGDV
jgi:AcrR family transcriptional regulator